MRKIGIVAVAACVGLALLGRAQNVSVAVVDLEELIRLHPNTASDKKLFEETIKDYRAEGQEMQRKLESLQEDFEKARKEMQDSSLSEKARKAAEEQAIKARDALAQADRTIREKMQSRQQQLDEMNMRMTRKTVGEIRAAVEKYAAEKKIQLVLPASTGQVMSASQILYHDRAIDITDAILKQMNIQRPLRTDADKVPDRREDAVKSPPVAPRTEVPAVRREGAGLTK